MDLPVRHVMLRDAEWLGEMRGLERAPDGSLSLRRVPAPLPEEAVLQDGPYEAAPSGIAAYGEDVLFIAANDPGRIICIQRDCDARFELGIGTSAAGFAIQGDTLLVADRSHGRVRRFLVSTLEEVEPVAYGLDDPTGVAVDSEGRVYILDRGAKRVLRLSANGTPDGSYLPTLGDPQFLTLNSRDELIVSDAADGEVHLFGPSGARLDSFSRPLRPDYRPRALIAIRDLLFVADGATGAIEVFEIPRRVHIGAVPDFCAPVAGMTADSLGNLSVKFDDGTQFRTLAASSGFVSAGFLAAGPFDAGELNAWERATATVLGNGDSLRLLTFVSNDPAAAVTWRPAPGLDCLVAREPGNSPSGRFIWLRAEFTGDGRTSATLDQVGASTRGASYLNDLPRIYRRDDQRTHFLERWLALFRGRIEDREASLDASALELDPQAAPARLLHTTADAVAFELPDDGDPAAIRALLARMPGLYAARGTFSGVRDMAEIHSGFRPRIFEAFESRHLWQLGTTSRLGFDTQLAAATPEGFIVPRDSRTDPQYAGLRGEYYAGIDFNAPLFARTDGSLQFANLVLRRTSNEIVQSWTVRWSGQIKPRFSETYLLRLDHPGGGRVWIDGQLIINQWKDEAIGQSDAKCVFDASRWHEIQVEVRSIRGGGPVRLHWSSRHQKDEAVPTECLYSLLDLHADLTPPPPSTFDVGHAVVGESGPLAASEFGDSLFGDYAHLFAVLAPAGSCRDAREREALREVIEAEKPAHTDYHLCFVEPRMRVGFQARLGIDAIVANGPPPLRLDGTQLDRDSYLDDAPGTEARVGARARLGEDTRVG